jgi:SAM-dependent methyltransferase
MDDATRAVRAILSNQLARMAPAVYVRLTGQTGRGSAPESAQDVADYFRRCFDEYFQQLAVRPDTIEDWLNGRVLLEYGPGDVPGVGLLMLAYGAGRVFCVDRFALARSTPEHHAILQAVLDGLEGERLERAAQCFNRTGEPASGFRPERLMYRVTRNGLSGLDREVDMIYSRAVLEHVNDLDATFDDMTRALKPGGVTIHQVDLKSHGLHRENPLDFLTWPDWLWNLMYSGKGVPNRLRIDRYHKALERSGLEIRVLKPTVQATPEDVSDVRRFLARPFKTLDDDSLRWLGFWLVAEKTARAT